jgi:hypothetical protein
MPGQVRIDGQVVDRAVVRYTPSPECMAVLCVRLSTSDGLTWSVRHPCGTQPADAMAAERKASTLRIGARCEVYAAGARVSTTRQGDPELVALGVSNVIPLGIFTPVTSGD